MTTTNREYPARPLVGVGVVVLRPNAVLLIRRGRPPGAGTWSFPGGAQRVGETAEAAARRELAEETGLTAGPLQLAAHVDSIHHDESGRIRFHYTILDFCGLWTGGDATAGGDAAGIAWVAFDRLDSYALSAEATHVLTQARRLLGL